MTNPQVMFYEWGALKKYMRVRVKACSYLKPKGAEGILYSILPDGPLGPAIGEVYFEQRVRVTASRPYWIKEADWANSSLSQPTAVKDVYVCVLLRDLEPVNPLGVTASPL